MQRDVNFFSVYRSSFRSGYSPDKTTVAGAAVLLTCLIVVLLLSAGFFVGNLKMTAQSDSIRTYLKQSSVSGAKNTVSSDNEKLDALRQYQKTASSQAAAFSSASTVDSALETVAKDMPSDVTITALDYKNKTMTLNCSCSNQLTPAAFVHKLASDNGFADVTYQGVNSSGNGTYTFTVTFTLKEALK